MEDPIVELKIILKLIFKKWDWGTWTRLLCLKIGKDGGFL